MSDENLSTERLPELAKEIRDLLERQRLVEQLVLKQDSLPERHDLVETLVHKQHLSRLSAKLESLHAADIARILELLPLQDRLVVWDLVKAHMDGDVLLEVSDAVRESLIDAMDTHELVAATEQLGTDEIADLAPDLPDEVVQGIYKTLNPEEREQLRIALSYPEDSVGAHMDFEMVSVREDVTVEVVLRYLRRLRELPDHTDKLFVVDREEHLRGVLPLNTLLVSDLDTEVGAIMDADPKRFSPDGEAREAAEAFERYDLISAPVLDADGVLIGRVTVAAIVDFIKDRQDIERLSQGGLRVEEDIFASVWNSLKNRGPWLGLNLITALIASRVIGLFEGAIEQLVALAALMPIVAGMGGNIGNQTITMIVRALATGQLHEQDIRNLYIKETKLALINGVFWGGMLALVTFLLYRDAALGGVMMLAVTLNFLLAAAMGVTIPVMRARFKRDPALGSSVLITAITDSGGFFIFLGLATLFLLH
ncbi:MAG: magnesium transporter [Halothiobacillaceae bacterium]|nr:MAG: magnesium transporter [Halothiobacillaceae bacterium]